MQYDDLLNRLGQSLERGDVSPAQVERLMRGGGRVRSSARPGAAALLAAMGFVVAYVGAGILFAIQWAHMSGSAKTLTPFLWPALALGAAVGLERAGRPRWASELAGLIGFAALAVAFVAAERAFRPVDDAHFGLVAGAIATGVVIALHLALRNVRLTGWGLSASLVAFSGSLAATAGAHGATEAAVVLTAQGGVAAAVCWFALRRSPETSSSAARTALLLFYLGAVVGQAGPGYQTLSVWHLVISLAVAGGFVFSVTLGFDGLVWIAALGSLLWLGMVGGLVGSSSGWAIALILVGVGLVGASLLVAAVLRRRVATG